LGQRYLSALLIVMMAGLLFAGLYPFNFIPANQVSWVPESSGLLFHGYGEVRGVLNPPIESQSLSEAYPGELTIELWVRSQQATHSVTDLVSVFREGSREPFAVEQYRTNLVIGGVFFVSSEKAEFRHLGIDAALNPGMLRFITITSGPQGTIIYLEGMRRDASRTRLLRKNLEGTLLLGQTPHGRQDWQGEIRGFAVYWCALRQDEVAASYRDWRQSDWQGLRARGPSALYTFSEGHGAVSHNRANSGRDLFIPKRFSAVDPVVLATPTSWEFANVSDITLNIAGFMPFGFLLFIHLRAGRGKGYRAALSVVVAGFTISAVIELLQVFLPSRDSSLLDLINNTVGSGMGACLGMVAWPWIHRVKYGARTRALEGPLGW
jgi:VanZ family protein